MILDAATEVALGVAALGLVLAAISLTALIFEHFDRKRVARKYDPTFAPRVAAGLRDWRGR